MTEHTDGAVSAADKIVETIMKYPTPKNMTYGEARIRIAAIIDQETAAERDRLRESTRICLSWVKTVAGQTPNRMTREIIKKAEDALTKEPEN